MLKRYENYLIRILTQGAAQVTIIVNVTFREMHLWSLVCVYFSPTLRVNS
jgi:hypothetical protein